MSAFQSVAVSALATLTAACAVACRDTNLIEPAALATPTSAVIRTTEADDPTLRAAAQARGISIASQVTPTAFFQDTSYHRVITSQYTTLVAGYPLKFAPVHPAQDRYSFTDADRLVNAAVSGGMSLHGHTLVWHETLPDWITTGTFTKEQLLAILKDHITTVVGRYRGKIATWDVVNEVVSEDGTGLRSTVWQNTIGPEYIDSAFVWAHQADPAAKLYLNDYRGEGMTTKAQTIFALVQQLRARGVPIDGVGFQSHFSTASAPSASDLQQNFTRFTAAGFDIRVSEMDVRIRNDGGADELQRQADIFRYTLDACLQQPRCTAFTTWGITDRYTWGQDQFPGYGRPLLFDSTYTAKPAFFAVRNRLMKR